MSQEYLELKRTLKKAGLSTKGNMATLAKRVKDSNIINVDDAIQAQPKTPSPLPPLPQHVKGYHIPIYQTNTKNCEANGSHDNSRELLCTEERRMD